ncbi:permease-like cell division protein FtsX [Micromonospora sp. NPDC048063]|uniref:permease-like cell division protein FtsX n=1 Tax=Micromonospora sp. NPDC048063 TaxID=3364256 RepID=UPI003710A5EB
MRRVAPVLALLLLAALSACTSEPKEAGHTTLTVLLDRDVTAAQKSVVEQRLRAMPSVTGVAFETREQAYEKLRKDSPDLVADLDPENLPESLHATVTDASVAEAVDLVMGTVDGVEWVGLKIADVDPVPSRIGAIVRLEPTATERQRAVVAEAVRALPHAESVEFEERDAAYERLRKQCQGKGDLATQLDSQVARASLRLQLPLNGKGGTGLPEIERLDGVEAIRLVPVAML